MAITVPAARTPPFFGRVIVPQSYGAVADGVSDAAAAFQSAVTAAEALAADGGPVTVYINGVFLLNSASNAAIFLTPNNTGSRGWINIVGASGSKIILSANTGRFLYLNKVADYDTFQKIRVEGLQIDAGNVPGRGGVIIGNVLSGGGTSTRINFADIVVRNCVARNLYEEASTATSQRMAVMLIGNHVSTLEATQTSTVRILVEDVEVYGGAGHSNVCSFGAAPGVTHYYNDIRFRRLRHVIATAPATNGSQTSYFICGTGFGDYCEIVDAYSKNISDDGVEIGAMQTVVLDRVRVEDPFLEAFFLRNFHAATDINRQTVTAVDCVVTVTGAGIAAASNGSVRHVAWAIGADNPFGTMRLIRPQYYVDGGSSTHMLPSYNSTFFGTTGVVVAGVEILSPKVIYSNFVFNRSSSYDWSLIYFNSPSNAVNPRLVVRDMYARLDGATVSGTAQTFISIIRVEGTAEVDIDGVDIVAPALTFGSGSFRIVDLGRSGAAVGARVRRIRPRLGTMGGVSTYGVAVNSTATLTIAGELEVSGCEFAGMATPTAEILIDATQAGRVRAIGNGLRNGQPPAASVTPSGSPYTYTNVTGYPKQLTIAGGTVSLIEVAGPTGSFLTTGLTSGAFTTRPGGRVRITYTVAPTVVEVPQN